MFKIYKNSQAPSNPTSLLNATTPRLLEGLFRRHALRDVEGEEYLHHALHDAQEDAALAIDVWTILVLDRLRERREREEREREREWEKCVCVYEVVQDYGESFG